MDTKKEPEQIVGAVCTLIFGAFTFLYLLFFQSDLLAYAQRSLSEGATTYNGVVGAVVITTALLLLSLLSSRLFTGRLSFAPALCHLPSALALAAMCDIRLSGAEESGVYGNVWIFSLAVFVVLLVANFVAKGVKWRFRDPYQSFSVNLLIMLIILIIPVSAGNTSEEDHVRLKMERCILDGDYDRVGELAHKYRLSTPEITMLRAYALSKSGSLGDEFFWEQVTGGSESLLPSESNRLLLISPLDIFKTIGGVPGEGVSARYCLERLHVTDSIHEGKKDYLLTACLMDKDLDAFVDYLQQDYDSTGVVPRHYREALMLYRRQHSDADINYHIPELEADFDDFQSMMRENGFKASRGSGLRRTYGNTYWYYYFFTSSSALTQFVSREN